MIEGRGRLVLGLPIVFDLGSPSSPLLEPAYLRVVLLCDHPSEAVPLVDLVGMPLRGFGLDLEVYAILEEIWVNSVIESVALRVHSKN